MRTPTSETPTPTDRGAPRCAADAGAAWARAGGVLLLAGLVVAGCPGSMTLREGGGGQLDKYTPWLDKGGRDSGGRDSGGPPREGSTPDTPAKLDKPPLVLDLPPPTPDKGPPVGGPCPCTAPLVCAGNACRKTCPPPTDPCKAVSTCGPTEACVLTSQAGLAVCAPAGGPGQACGVGVFCATNNVCATTNGGKSYTCVPTCAALGAPCGAGGSCLNYQGCLFCSTP